MTLRELANLMAHRQVSSVPVVDRNDPLQVLSVMATEQVLEARLRDLNEEHHTERVISLPRILSVGSGRVLMRGRRERESDEEGERRSA
jgi:hypothetical protein